MKKVLLTIALIGSLSVFGNSFAIVGAGGGIIGDIDLQPDPTVRCRCKHGGCYAGSAISLRPMCATGGTVSCTSFDSNCFTDAP